MSELQRAPLETVEDALKLFSLLDDFRVHGKPAPPVSHVFFAREDDGLLFSPYSIRAVAKSDRPSNYYVVTKTHVTHVSRAMAMAVEAVPVQQWCEEARLFDEVRKLQFFKTYLKAKALRLLCDGARARRQTRHRMLLSKELLLTKREFRSGMSVLNTAALEIRYRETAQKNSDGKMVSATSVLVSPEKNSGGPLTLADFKDVQRQYSRSLQEYLTTVLSGAQDLLAEKRRQDGSQECAITKLRPERRPPACEPVSTKNARLNEEQVAQKQALFALRGAMHLTRLARCIIGEAAFLQLYTTLNDLSSTIKNRGTCQRSYWQFRVDCVVNDGNLHLFPSCNDIVSCCHDVMNNSAAVLARLRPPRLEKNATSYRSHDSVGKAPAYFHIDDSVLPHCLKSIMTVVKNDYSEASKCLALYSSLHAVELFQEEWNAQTEAWVLPAAGPSDTFRAMQLKDVESKLKKLKKLGAEVRTLVGRSYGTVYVSCDNAVSRANKTLEDISTEIVDILQNAREELAEVMEQEKTALLGGLKTPELRLSPYTEWLCHIEEADAQVPNFLARFTDFRSIAEMLSACPSNSDDSKETYDLKELDRTWRDPLLSTLSDAKQHRSATISSVKGLATQRHKELLESCVEIQRELVENYGSMQSDRNAPALDELAKIELRLDSISKKTHALDSQTEICEMPQWNWSQLGATKELFAKYKELWTLYEDTEKYLTTIDTVAVSEINGEELNDQLVSLVQRAFKCAKTVAGTTAEYLTSTLSTEKGKLSSYLELCNQALTEDHWDKLFSVCRISPIPAASRTLRECERAGLIGGKYTTDVAEVVSSAVGVFEIKQHLAKLAQYYDARAFEVIAYSGRTDTHIIDGVSDFLDEREEQELIIQTCLASKYASDVKDEIEMWAKRLSLIGSTVKELIAVQKSWVYLEFIFSSEDIKRQLPDESLLFSSADRIFGNTMKSIVADPRILSLCVGNDDALKKLVKCNHQLDGVQKKLDDYLETKRAAFHRFYFLSNDELLSILSDSRNPLAVQPHMQKCFDSIKELVFADMKTVKGMKSSEGEIILFTEPVRIMGNVESWLNDVEKVMRDTLYRKMTLCLEDYDRGNRATWYFNHPAQCVLTVDQVFWTGEVEEVIHKVASGDSAAWPRYVSDYRTQLLDTVALLEGNTATLKRVVLTNVIVSSVHCLDISTKLADTLTYELEDFAWQRQLRYYWTPQRLGSRSKECLIMHGAAELLYGYEYLGCQPRLVITPLTERAFLTCTIALHMQKGAAPQGPAGTGKTESVKDLGKALARHVVVFNCSDGLNYRMMSQMFAGLAQGGAWACFDEFNRIELQVLSVIAQQMLDITTAIANKETALVFDGRRIQLNPDFGVFITMNPGYAGRTELPDNLNALFRPICMMIPNYALIAEIMFYSEGYVNARVLAEKMVHLYSLASQQLSRQDHYDFGMRAIKSILVLAGHLKRAEPNTDEEILLVRAIRDANLPKFLSEDVHLFLSLMDDFFPTTSATAARPAAASIVCKAAEEVIVNTLKLEVTEGLLSKCQQLFDTLVTRHGLMLVGRTMTGKSTLREALCTALTNLGASSAAADAQDVNGGQSPAALDSRKRAYLTLTSQWTCNPKAVTMNELYGDVNPLTREWQDGIFSSVIRELVKQASAQHSSGKEGEVTENTPSSQSAARNWVVFDGPVDAMWIENLNTVLDDSKMLCLVNGERIRIPETISVLFEVGDLSAASPATVSRCGMVYTDEAVLEDGWSPLARSLAVNCAKRFGQRWRQSRFEELCSEVVCPVLQFVREHCKEYIPSVNGQLVRNLVVMLQATLDTFVASLADGDGGGVSDYNQAETPGSRRSRAPSLQPPPARHRSVQHRRSSVAARASAALLGDGFFDAVFLQSCVWAVGGNLADASRGAFSVEMLRLIREQKLHFPVEEAARSNRSVFDYVVDLDVGDWRPWTDTVPTYSYNMGASFFDQVVPTAHSSVLNFLLRTATTARHHVLLNGVTGTAKSSSIASFLASTLQVEEETSPFCAFSFVLSARTSSTALQELVESRLTKRKGERTIGPPLGKEAMIAVIDDCNMPQREQFGASPPIELLRQVLSQGGFYDRKKLFFKEVVQTMLVACCGEPGGGKNEMTPRFSSKMLMFCAPQLSHEEMHAIFSAILEGFYDSHGFAAEVTAAAAAVVDSTLTAYRRIASECLPTPEKTHCSFNLRDVAKVVQGMLQVKPEHCQDREQVIALWSHEASRVFHDRLVDDDDRVWWWRCVQETVTECFEQGSPAPDVPEVHAEGAGIDTGSTANALRGTQPQQLMYGSWASDKTGGYQRIPNDPSTEAKVLQYLADYNVQSTTSMELVFFSEALQHLSRICRVISQPRGHALLVGVGGSGRSSLCRLASFMMNMNLQTIAITRGYGPEEFRTDMRKALLDAGARGMDVAFLLSDPQIVCTEMLEDVNNVLNLGEVPGIMQLEDVEVIVRLCREPALAAGYADTRSSLSQYFVRRCRERLHILLCMSPKNAQFRERLRLFPALVNCTTIDWFTDWSQDALLAVGATVLKKEPQQKQSPGPPAAVCTLMTHIHTSTKAASTLMYEELHRHNHATPASFLAALAAFQQRLEVLQHQIDADTQRYRSGLATLDGATRTVADLQKRIREMQPSLTAAAKEAEEQQCSVRAEQADADALRAVTSQEELVAKSLMEEAESIRKECEEGLAEAMPALEAATAALATITPKDIQEIKTFTTPPSNVEKTMNAVLVLLKEKEGWASAKSCLNKLDFMSRLTGYPRDEMSAAIVRKVAVFMNDPDFVPDTIEKTSLPCRSMCMWVHAMYRYYYVAKDVAPKRARLRDAEAKADVARSALSEKQASLQKILARVAELQAAAQAAQAKADTLNHEVDTAKTHLQRAAELTDGLASERVRWTANLGELERQRKLVEGTAVLGAACVTYLGAFTLPYRERLLAQWKSKCDEVGVLYDANFTLEKLMSEEVVQQWAVQSLPRDAFSIQNATIMQLSSRCCYMIDPQGQFNSFIRKREGGAGHGLLVLNPANENFMRSLEGAIQTGQPVLLEGVGENIDAALEPVLLKKVRRVGGRNVLTLGDKEIVYDDAFRLYLTTALPNPTLSPELQVKVTVINATVTREGLEEQLLADIVGTEQVALQQRSDRCVVSIAASHRQIRALEEQVLHMLSSATGDVLENVELIEALRVSRETAEKVGAELKEMETTSTTIAAAREQYRRLATRGSLIYGTIASLPLIDPMYDYSLQFFKRLTISVLHASSTGTEAPKEGSSAGTRGSRAGSTDVSTTVTAGVSASSLDASAAAGVMPLSDEHAIADRVSSLVDELTWTSFRVVSRGLFERHKSAFRLHLTTTILKSVGDITEDEWAAFLRGGSAGGAQAELFRAGESAPQPPLLQQCLTASAWASLGALCTLPPFAGTICRSFFDEPAEWVRWVNAETQEDGTGAAVTGTAEPSASAQREPPFPAAAAPLSAWHALMLVKVLTPHRLYAAAQSLTSSFLGDRYIHTLPFNLRATFADSSKQTPIIFILSPGTDPTTMFTSFAEEMGFGEKKYMLSLGEDQGPRAQKMIEAARREGYWVYLQNCHVYTSWMPELQRLVVDAGDPQDTHDDFRLWLTSKPSPSFPSAVLQAGIKLTREPPAGLRGKVQDTLAGSSLASAVFPGTPAVAAESVSGVAGGARSRQGSLRSQNSTRTDDADGGLGASPVVLTGAHGPLWRRLTFTLALLHGIVLERRTYGPLGWNTPYEWSAADFNAGMCSLRTALSRSLVSAGQPEGAVGGGHAPDTRRLREELTLMLGEIDYGGRVTDSWDNRCLSVMVAQLFAEQDAAPGGGRSAADAGPLRSLASLPEDCRTMDDLLQFVDAHIPDDHGSRATGAGGSGHAGSTSVTSWFGLHANAAIAVSHKQSAELVQSLVSVYSGGNSGPASSTRDGDELVVQIAEDLVQRLPTAVPALRLAFGSSTHSSRRPSGNAAARADQPDDGSSPLQVLLSHEVDLYNRLLVRMTATLKEVIRAVRGEEVMTRATERMARQLSFNSVPDNWDSAAYPSRKPLAAFFADFLCRMAFISRWRQHGVPASFWLPGLFFPQGFLTAVLQTQSRASKTPIDALVCRYHVLPSSASDAMKQESQQWTSPAETDGSGAYIHGLFLEGAGWDEQRGGLVESRPGVLAVELPVIHVEPIVAPNASSANEPIATYVCPLYKVSSRAGALSTTGVSTNYVVSLQLPSGGGVSSAHWTLRGVAALCSLDA